MLIVTGTKRSGTSMWMQILRAAGIRVHGEAFPRDWGDMIRAANPHGFFESPLRQGIYFATNPHPKSGAYLHPRETRDLAVKVFIPGVVRSDLAFVDKVLASLRGWREYHGSLMRLYELEREARREKLEAEGKAYRPPAYLSPVLEWWRENYALIADHLLRRYPIHIVAYESVLEDPHRYIPEALEWLGVGDVSEALRQVDPSVRTHRGDAHEAEPDLPDDVARTFDGLYERVRDRRPIEPAFVEELNATQKKLAPRIEEELREVRRRELERRKALREQVP